MSAPHWDEAASQAFIDYGRYFVPERQFEILIRLLPDVHDPLHILELCCGEGLLAEAGFQAVDVFWPKAGHAICGGQRP